MNEAAQNSLRHKLAANHARRERERFLATLPDHLAAPLRSARFLVPPESIPILSHVCITEDGLGYPARILPDGYTYQAFSWPEPLLAAADRFPGTYDSQPAFLRPHGDLPFFCVLFGWARTHFRAMFPYTPHGHLVIVAESLQVGLVSDAYGGYLNDVVTDHEAVYELAFWHPTANA